MEFLNSKKAYQIIDEINCGNSFLFSLGCYKQFFRSLPLKILALILYPIIMFGVKTAEENRRYVIGRKRLVTFLRKIGPFKMRESLPPYYARPLVIGFNHSSTGDILRILAIILDRFPAKTIFFPVNLVFYESLSVIAKRLEKISIYVYPIITPSLFKKMQSERNQKILASVKLKLERNHLCQAELCCRGYGILVVAPSATRKATVFDNRAQSIGEANDQLLPTMTFLLKRLQKNQKIVYLAVSLRPQRINRGLNLFRPYHISVAKEFTTEKALELDARGKKYFDYAFLKAIAEKLPFEFWHPPEQI